MITLRIRGFSLIELMIAVAIVAILASIAYPSYRNSIMKSNRAEAKIELTQAASLQEKWYFQKNAYFDDSGTSFNDAGVKSVTPKGNYAISADQQPCGDNSCFRMIATAQGAQLDDTDCLMFTINSKGEKKSYSDTTGTTESTGCWD